MSTKLFCDLCNLPTDWNYASYHTEIEGVSLVWHTRNKAGNRPDICKPCMRRLLHLAEIKR